MTSGSLQCAAVTFAGLTVCGNGANAARRVARGSSSGDAGYIHPVALNDAVSFIDGVSFRGAEDTRRLAGSGTSGSVGGLDAFGDRVTGSVSMKITGLRTQLERPSAAARVHLENDQFALINHRAPCPLLTNQFPHTCNRDSTSLDHSRAR